MTLATALIAVALAAIGFAVVEVSGDREPAAPPPPKAPASAGGGERPKARTSFLSRLIPPPPERSPGPSAPSSVADLARRLPLERKVAQLFVWGFEGRDLTAPIFERMLELDLGGILVRDRNYVDAQQLAALAGEAAVIARNRSHVPPLVFSSQEGAEFNAFPDLPPVGAPADYDAPEGAAAAAGGSADTLGALGVNALLGPVADVGAPDGGALGARAFSDQPGPVATFARGAVEEYAEAGVLAAPKHFPGLGAATQDTEEGPASVGLTLEELAERDLVPFAAAFEAGAPAVVIGHGLYATDDFVTPASLSRTIATRLLRRRMGFRGVAIADDLSAPAVTAVSPVPDAAVAALRAGADLLLISGPAGDQEAAYLAVLNAARKGDVSRRRIDQAVLRVLTAKQRLGLIERS